MATTTRQLTAKEIAAAEKVEAAKEKLRLARKKGKEMADKAQKKQEQAFLKLARTAGVFKLDSSDEELTELFAGFVAKKQRADIQEKPHVAAQNSIGH